MYWLDFDRFKPTKNNILKYKIENQIMIKMSKNMNLLFLIWFTLCEGQKRAFYKLEKKITLNLEYYNENTHETRNIFKPKYKYHS